MAANADMAETAPFIIPDEKMYEQEVHEIAEIRAKLHLLKQYILSEESAAAASPGNRSSAFTNPVFNNAAASTDSLATSMEKLSLYEKKELKADLDLRLSQLLTIVTQDKKNPVKIAVENELREIEMQRREDEELDRVYHRGMKWTIGVAVGFGLMCIMLPATALLLVQKGVI